MGNKGPLDVKMDVPALNEIIVYTRQFKAEVSEKIDQIRTLVTRWTEDESFNGGDAENIKANFIVIAKGCDHLAQSIEFIDKKLNEKLEVLAKMNKNTTSSASSDAASSAANKMGVLRKN